VCRYRLLLDMHLTNILRLYYAAIVIGGVVATPTGSVFQRRQDVASTDGPTLTSGNGQESATSSPTVDPSSDSKSEEPTASGTESANPSTTPSSRESNEPSLTTTTPSHRSASSTPLATPSAAPSNETQTPEHKKDEELPIQPRITPAFSIGGVILILTGTVYTLVGVKNRWVQISLSTAYLASLAVTVLIAYVMSPPVSDGIQGAYFVGIFMTGIIFGAGALIFKEVTEGFGCLLGGFCLSMWFLTLKPGGLITNQAGKGIFIAVFCVVLWSFSFSHYTRAYALIGSTAFSGATALTLGIDCFSRAGLKEFWFYLWDLNDNLFPLGTTTFPQTRGIRVEIIVIILATIIGIISQIKLWKIVRDRRKKQEEARKDDERRRDVVEQVIGRELERRNDKDRANWEKQYGNTLQSKRSTILWSDAHPDKSYTHVQTLEKRSSSSSDSLEMVKVSGKRHSQLKRQSSAITETIPEEAEDQDARASCERQKALTKLQDNQDAAANQAEPKAEDVPESRFANPPPKVIPLPLKIPLASQDRRDSNGSSMKSPKSGHFLQEPKSMSKRRSLQSLLSLSPRLSGEGISTSESQEALVLPSPNSDRPSSIAATLDEEHDLAELRKSKSYSEPPTPKIVISPAGSFDDLKEAAEASNSQQVRFSIVEAPPSPPALSASFDFEDPEELARPVEKVPDAKPSENKLDANKRLSHGNKSSSASESEKKRNSNSDTPSNLSTGQTSEILTKGALDQVPSQTSNVVLTYRTNEWAKHISTADAPIYDEPEPIEEADNELPTQLASSTLDERPVSPPKPLDESRTLSVTSKPPTPHVVASPIGVVANVQPPQRSDSQQSNTLTQPPVVHQSKSMRSSKGKRSSTGPGGAKASTLVTIPIDENAPSQFVPAQLGQIAVAPQRMHSSTSLASQPGAGRGNLTRSSTTTSVDDSILRMSYASRAFSPPPAMRSEPRLASYDTQPKRSPSALGHAVGFRSETRLSNTESRQPHKRELNQEAQKREQLLANWRISQQQGLQTNVAPKMGIDTRRAQMLLDKEHKRLMEDQARAVKAQKEMQIDQVMRRPDMQDAHREVMRRMQAKVTK
jgi:hypothetical protein